MRRSFNTLAWLVWLTSAAALTLLTRNPFYLILLLLVARIVQNACGREEGTIKIAFWRFALIVFTFSILFNLLLVHVGQTVLFRVPQSWWLIGGPFTLEAVLYGIINALILITLLAVFLSFNSIVLTSDLVSLAPRALANIGVVVLIAISYVPETLAHLSRVREAQALRGQRISGLRDWRPIIIPLLIGGLERSLNLAETMVSRGYGATANRQLSSKTRLLLLAGLLMMICGWVAAFWQAAAGWLLVAAGAGFMVIAYVDLGKRHKRTRYQVSRWHAQDWLLAGISLVPLAFAVLPFPGIREGTVFYTPYPSAEIPPFDPLLGLAIALLAAPTVLVDL